MSNPRSAREAFVTGYNKGTKGEAGCGAIIFGVLLVALVAMLAWNLGLVPLVAALGGSIGKISFVTALFGWIAGRLIAGLIRAALRS